MALSSEIEFQSGISSDLDLFPRYSAGFLIATPGRLKHRLAGSVRKHATDDNPRYPAWLISVSCPPAIEYPPRPLNTASTTLTMPTTDHPSPTSHQSAPVPPLAHSTLPAPPVLACTA